MKYVMTSGSFNGHVLFEFDETTKLLLSFDTSNAYLSEKQQIWLLKELPRELKEVEELLSKAKNVKFEKLNENITFEMFWDRYNDKITSSKKRTRKAWDKMSKADQAKAFRFISKYENSLPQGTRKKYAETYLNAELWNN